MNFTDHGNGIFTVDNFFTKEECQDWIEKSETIGYEEAKINLGKKQVMMKGVRNNERLLYDSQEFKSHQDGSFFRNIHE